MRARLSGSGSSARHRDIAHPIHPMLMQCDSPMKMESECIGELEAHWSVVEAAFRDSVSKGFLSESVTSHIEELCNHGMLPIMELWLLDFAEEVITEAMQSYMSATSKLQDVLPFLQLAAKDILRTLEAARWLRSKTGKSCVSAPTCSGHELDIEEEVLKLSSRLSTSLVTAEFDSLMLELFQRSFRAFHKTQSADDCSGLVFCPGCNVDIADDESLCSCAAIVREFVEINEVVNRIGAFPSLVHDCVQSVCFDLIKKHVVETCQGDFENKCASNLEQWLNETVVSWLQTISGQTTSMISAFKNNLLYFLHDIFIEFRAGQLFDMIVDFPDSKPALEDLRDCIQKVRSLEELVTKLKQAMTTRLFHPGVKTADIITAYVSTIKALRVLDPSGFILQSICDELSVYLKSRDNRDNTVRIIVSSLTDENNVELNAELSKCAQKPPALGSYLDGSSDDESEWQKWVPQAKVSRIIKSSDIITLLVNIYGSKEVFVEEYASLLSERLLNGSSDTQKEIMYMELLKVRFGEMAMNNCEVMLNDVKCSKRLHSQIIQEKLSDQLRVPLDSLIISAQFWPELKEETIKIPESVTQDFEKFRKEYEILNGNRTVNLRPNLGFVDLDLELDDGTVKSVKCSTAQATLIQLFHEKNHWRMADIASALECSRITVKRLVAFWTQQGVLIEGGAGPDGIVVIGSEADEGEIEHALENRSFVDEEMDDDEDGMSRPNKLQEVRYLTFTNFVKGLLTNLGETPLDRIYSMLKMFAASSWVDFTIQDCKQFMDTKVKSGDVVYSSGLYSLPAQ